MARDLNDTLMFVKVVEHGSFVSAARALGLPKTNVSRKVQELEERLRVQLLRTCPVTQGPRIRRFPGRASHPRCRQPRARPGRQAASAVGSLGRTLVLYFFRFGTSAWDILCDEPGVRCSSRSACKVLDMRKGA